MDPRRQLPSVERVLQALDPSLVHAVRVRYAREAIERARARLASGEPVTDEDVIADASGRVRDESAPTLVPLVNATGVLLHTNLGRAPLGGATVQALAEVAGYSNLEYRLDEGTRGSRHDHAGHLLATACGAATGIVVNNNAAAVLLALAALARGREVVVSRGELVEIGGGFRVPEIMAETGARLVEVGTTNRTRLADYARACTDATALVLKVHASNYRMTGFVESTPVAELATLGVPVVVDAGSGLLDERTPWLDAPPGWLTDEPGVRQCLTAGAALVTFSADKLLGGPQGGVVVGASDLVERCRAHPLARAVRADKLTLAALQQVARTYLDGTAAELPLWRMATVPLAELRARAHVIARALDGCDVVDTESVPGGGSVPGLGIPSAGVSIAVDRPHVVLARLRGLSVVARAESGRVVADLRTVEPDDDELLAAALRAATRPA